MFRQRQVDDGKDSGRLADEGTRRQEGRRLVTISIQHAFDRRIGSEAELDIYDGLTNKNRY